MWVKTLSNDFWQKIGLRQHNPRDEAPLTQSKLTLLHVEFV